MITRLDHIVLICRDFDRAVKNYTHVLGRGPSRRTSDESFKTALFTVSNTALEIKAPAQNSPAKARIEELLEGKQGGLSSLAFQAEDIKAAHHILGRRGLRPTDLSQDKGESLRSFRCPDDVCAGIKTFVVEADDQEGEADTLVDGHITSLDHLVINTPNPIRSLVHYGARLGLRLALDRTIEAFKTRFLFFRVGGLTLEVIHRLDQSLDANDPDNIWGLTWAVDDLHAAHERLTKSGLDISPIRTGRKPGSHVFTLRNGTMGIPTLFIAHSPKNTG